MKTQYVLAFFALIASAVPAWAVPADFIEVPEPASLLLFGTGAGALLLARQLRRRGKRD